MKAVMVIQDSSAWRLELTPTTPTEKAMLDAVWRGYGTRVTCGDDQPPSGEKMLVIEGGGEPSVGASHDRSS